jgi:DNA (cytosine-5)-methyltransferase 1
MEPAEILEIIYSESMVLVGSDTEIKSDLDSAITIHLLEILAKSESSKGVLTVVLTSLVYKIIHPLQDIRMHQTGITGGYSGRTFDSKFITPFLKSVNFPAMAESGWLTRSLEQKVPYDHNYSGAITPSSLKIAFLETIAFIQNSDDVILEKVLSFLFQGLIIKRNSQQINLAKPLNLPIATIITILSNHFSSKYSADGASRLPVLALYAAYQCLVVETRRFDSKTLLEIESHTSADSRSGRIGDIDIVDSKGRPFEAVEVKFGIPITVQLIKDAFEKFKTTQVNRYYLLSTANIDNNQREEIANEIERIKNIHGCHVIANGLIPSLKYYLRLLSDTSEFISNYVNLLENDTALKFEHKQQWNTVISQM